ncbi:hypothetical protein [Spirosoma validum]|uniref:Uncharacterized protein n=1 Tax=Spirosoma validum TaxID=2771355 RepID=A0A927B6X4_9BACT|nr:hypothetical protein [Spirosoma validum]MBD2756815.1 hypothetical protein [Spirosoma validum]
MRTILLVIFFFPSFCKAQSNVTGLGTYTIGITTPDSLSQTFKEQDQSYVKGTIALPCTHIRVLKASTVTTGGLVLTNLILFFYDNRLFKLSCDYSPAVVEFLRTTNGKGTSPSPQRTLLCTKHTDDPLVLRGEFWLNADIIAFVVRAKGYNADCQREEAAKLSISSQRFSALSSDCDLKNTDLFIEEFEKVVSKYPQRPQPKER